MAVFHISFRQNRIQTIFYSSQYTVKDKLFFSECPIYFILLLWTWKYYLFTWYTKTIRWNIEKKRKSFSFERFNIFSSS